KEVRIGLRAQTQFEKLRKNTEERQGSKAAGQFVDDFEKTKNQLKRTPDMFEESTIKKGARRALFGKYGAFLYRVYNKFIRIVVVFDTRTDTKR
ncbi:MAG: type II toxin-antitoxin system RelE/ParE family toxin, partial [Aureispira sp.]